MEIISRAVSPEKGLIFDFAKTITFAKSEKEYLSNKAKPIFDRIISVNQVCS